MAPESSPTYLFGDLLALARQSWVRAMADRLGQRGHGDYRRSDAAVMRLLRHRSLSIGELGEVMGVTRQAARKIAAGLQRRGYARLERDPRDSRRLNVVLSAAGEEYARDVSDVIEILNRELRDRVDAADLLAADTVLRAAIGDARERARAGLLVRPPVIADPDDSGASG